MTQLVKRERRLKVTEDIKRTVSRLVDQENDWVKKKKHPSRWYRKETARKLGLNESNNPSLRSYEELCRETRKNARVQNSVDKPWNTALLNGEALDPEIVPWIATVQYYLQKNLSKPLNIREVKWFVRLFGFRTFVKPLPEIQDNPDLVRLFVAMSLSSWAQIYAETEKVDEIAGINNPDYSNLDIAIAENDFSAIREYSDQKLIDQVHGMRGKQSELTVSKWAKILEGWTLPSLRHNIMILESTILGHSLGDPDMSPEYLRAYHNLLFGFDYGRNEDDYGATYQEKIDTFMGFRKKIQAAPEDDISQINKFTFPPNELWWEQLWGGKKRAKIAKKKEVK
jgi:hypothetical protein